MTNLFRMFAISLGGVVLASGCLESGDEVGSGEGGTETGGEPGEATTTTEQDVSWTALQWHSCSSTSCSWSLGDPATSTCFIAGITGKLAGGSVSYPAGVNVVNNGTYWGLYIDNPNYNDIGVMTTCIPNTGHRTEGYWVTGDPATLIPAGASVNRKCFLSGIWNRNNAAFSTWESNVTVTRDPESNDYWIGGSFPSGSYASVFARCVDIPLNYGNWGVWWGYPYNTTDNLAFNPASGGVACGLTGIGGQLNVADTNKGVWIGYNASTRYWNWTFTPGIHGYAQCFK